MKTWIIVAFLLLPVLGFCQQYIGQTHAVVLAGLKKQNTDTEKAVLTITDTVITIHFKKSPIFPVTHSYYFDKTGKCAREKVVAGCDTCFTTLLGNLLKKDNYKWKKINENQYVSRFEDKMTIELPVEKTTYSFMIMRTDWTRTLYDLLVGK